MSSTKTNEWSSDLCDCFSDRQSCCLTYWCPCVAFGRIANIVDRGAISCCAAGTCCSLLGWLLGCTWIYTYPYRSKIRQQYSLKSSPCHDCLVHCFCGLCALCQEYRELQARGFDMSLGWEGNVARNTRGVSMAPDMQGGMKR